MVKKRFWGDTRTRDRKRLDESWAKGWDDYSQSLNPSKQNYYKGSQNINNITIKGPSTPPQRNHYQDRLDYENRKAQQWHNYHVLRESLPMFLKIMTKWKTVLIILIISIVFALLAPDKQSGVLIEIFGMFLVCTMFIAFYCLLVSTYRVFMRGY
jgi:hypothetical protein